MKKMTYGKFLADWYKVYKKPFMRSYGNIERNIRLHVPKHIKNMPLNELDFMQIQLALNSLGSCRTALDVYDIYHGSLNMAYKLDYIAKDISQLLIKPKHTRVKGCALTKEEQTQFISRLEKSRCRYAFKFLLYSGVRRGELLSLRWEDIDLNSNMLHIRGTKTKTSDRLLPICADLHCLLLELMAQKPLRTSIDRVFTFRAEYLSKQFNAICPNHKLHDLRHTFATRCFESGLQLKTISAWLGHSTIKTTADIYSHLLNDFQQEEIQKLKF